MSISIGERAKALHNIFCYQVLPNIEDCASYRRILAAIYAVEREARRAERILLDLRTGADPRNRTTSVAAPKAKRCVCGHLDVSHSRLHGGCALCECERIFAMREEVSAPTPEDACPNAECNLPKGHDSLCPIPEDAPLCQACEELFPNTCQWNHPLIGFSQDECPMKEVHDVPGAGPTAENRPAPDPARVEESSVQERQDGPGIFKDATSPLIHAATDNHSPERVDQGKSVTHNDAQRQGQRWTLCFKHWSLVSATHPHRDCQAQHVEVMPVAEHEAAMREGA